MFALTEKDLNKFGFFIPLSKDTMELIKLKGRKNIISKGSILFNEKDNVDKVYFVLDGKVTMYRLAEGGQKRVIYILNAGEFVNEVIFDNLPASISCEAFEDSTVLYLFKNDLLNMMSKDFELSRIIINSMGRKIRRLYRQIKNTVPLKMDKKVAAKLWKLSKDYGIDTEEGTLININLSITYLASMLGSTRETISKCISKFQKEGLIKFKGKKIIIPDRKALSIYFRGIDEYLI